MTRRPLARGSYSVNAPGKFALQTVRYKNDVRKWVAATRSRGRTIGCVPTMGALHAGHRSLIQAATQRCDDVVVSVFVNPTQFGPGEDFERYPNTLESDLQMCRDEHVGLVFTPSVDEMYSPERATTVHVSRLTDGLCGANRPGHFDGVATVVTKLLNIMEPDAAFFGEKDYQQLRVIEQLVEDLDRPISIVACPTIRDEDGLATSSRNAYLSDDDRHRALSLSRAMRDAIEQVAAGIDDCHVLCDRIRNRIAEAGINTIEYVSIVDSQSLTPVDRLIRPARVCVAAHVGSCRLIDNMPVDACKGSR